MARIPEYPPILHGTPDQKIEQLREYIMRQVTVQIEQQHEEEKAAANKEKT